MATSRASRGRGSNQCHAFFLSRGARGGLGGGGGARLRERIGGGFHDNSVQTKISVWHGIAALASACQRFGFEVFCIVFARKTAIACVCVRGGVTSL